MNPDYPLNTTIIHDLRHKMIEDEENWIALISGPPGSGKSVAALSLGMRIDEDFDVDKQVVFTSEEFLKLLNHGDLKAGSIIIWDEAGVDLDAHQWMSLVNKLLRKVFATFRHKHIGVIFTYPFKQQIDSGTMKLIHTWIPEVVKLKRYRVSLLKFLWYTWNERVKHEYVHLPMKFVDGKLYKCEYLKIKIPSKKIIDLYDVRSESFKEQTCQDAEFELERLKMDKIKNKKLSISYVYEKVMENRKKYFFTNEKGKERLNYGLIMDDFGLGRLKTDALRDYIIAKDNSNNNDE